MVRKRRAEGDPPFLTPEDVQRLQQETYARRPVRDEAELAREVLRWRLQREPTDAEVAAKASDLHRRRTGGGGPIGGGPLFREEVPEVEERFLALRVERRDHVDETRARRRARQALDRMDSHEQMESLLRARGNDPMVFVPEIGRPGPPQGTGYTFETEEELLVDYLRKRGNSTDPLTRQAYEQLSGVAHQTVSDTLARFHLDWPKVQRRAGDLARTRRATP